MTSSATPFYLDWTFWAVIASVLALILSQLPPIKQWFRGPVLLVETARQMRVTHGVGHPTAGLVLSLRNVGGRGVRINAVAFKFRRDGRDLVQLPVGEFYPNPLSNETLAFMPFTLDADAETVRSVNSYEELSRDGNRQIARLVSEVRRDIGQKIEKRDQEKPGSKELVTLDDALLREAKDMFERYFIWRTGEYEMEIAITTEVPCTIRQERFKFTLWESDETDLRDLVDGYAQGFGIGVPSEKHGKGVFVTLAAVH